MSTRAGSICATFCKQAKYPACQFIDLFDVVAVMRHIVDDGLAKIFISFPVSLKGIEHLTGGDCLVIEAEFLDGHHTICNVSCTNSCDTGTVVFCTAMVDVFSAFHTAFHQSRSSDAWEVVAVH